MNKYNIRCLINGTETILKLRGKNKKEIKSRAVNEYGATKIKFIDTPVVDYVVKNNGISLVKNSFITRRRSYVN